MFWSKEKDLVALASGRFEWDIPVMTLQKRGGHSQPYTGSGIISQDKNGELEFKIFAVNNGAGLDPFQWNSEPGELIKDEEYYILTANLMDGRVWECTHVIPNAVISHDRSMIVARGYINELTNKTSLPFQLEIASITMYFFQEVSDFPWNQFTETTAATAGDTPLISSHRNVAKFTACGHSFLIRGLEGNGISVNIENIDFVPFFEKRIVEALQFVLARPMPWQFMETSKRDGICELRLRCHRKLMVERKHRPPTSLDLCEDVFRLFDLYLKYILPCDTNTWHRISELLFQIHGTSSQDPDVHVLNVSIAAEGIAITCFNELGSPTADELSQFNEALKLIRSGNFNETVLSRLTGVIGQMKKSRSKDVFKQLIKNGVIRERDYKAWNSIRHAAAHSSVVENRFSQTRFDSVDSVITLCNHMVFHVIGYSGKYLDYGTRGWPERDYLVPIKNEP